MTEDEWLTCTDSRAMLAYLQAYTSTSDRKLIFLAVACIRRVSHLFTDDGSRQAVDVLERLADGGVTREELARLDAAFPPGAAAGERYTPEVARWPGR